MGFTAALVIEIFYCLFPVAGYSRPGVGKAESIRLVNKRPGSLAIVAQE